ncbi:MAG TPA: hypothetical protein VFX65_09175 [Candidatus Limnocylindrales bacterium]|nr:hypothetical protein [Candidatus Limnocylindrales bacterium]
MILVEQPIKVGAPPADDHLGPCLDHLEHSPNRPQAGRARAAALHHGDVRL